MAITLKEGAQVRLSTILEGENASSYRDAEIKVCGVDATESLPHGLFICLETVLRRMTRTR